MRGAKDGGMCHLAVSYETTTHLKLGVELCERGRIHGGVEVAVGRVGHRRRNHVAGGRRAGVVGLGGGERRSGSSGHGNDPLADISHCCRRYGSTGYRDLWPLAARNEPLWVGERRRRWIRGEHGWGDRV